MNGRLSFTLVSLVACAGLAWAGEPPTERYPIAKEGKWGYMDRSGKVAIDYQYDWAWDFSEGLACVQVGQLRGYIDATGKMVIKPEYALARAFSEGLAAVAVGVGKFGTQMDLRGSGRWVYIDKTGKIVIDPPQVKLSFADDLHEGEARVRMHFNGHMRTSVMNTKGATRGFLPKPVGRFSEGLLALPGPKGYGYIDHAGKYIIPEAYPDAGEFVDGLAPVAILLDLNDPARTTTWTQAAKFSLGLRNAPENTWGLKAVPLDEADAVPLGASKTFTFQITAPAKEGKYNFQCQLQQQVGFGEVSPNLAITVVAAAELPVIATQPKSLAAAVGATATFSVSASAKEALTYQWKKNGVEIPGATAESYTTPALTREDDGARFCVIASAPGGALPSVEAVLTVQAEGGAAPAEKPAEGTASSAPKAPPAKGVRQENGARFVSQSVPATLVAGQPYTVSVTMKNSGPQAPKWGFIDKSAKIVLEPRYESARAFSEGLARVQLGGKWGYLDKTGKMVVEPQYDYAAPFSEGLARIVLGGKHGYIDASGKVVVEPKYDVGWEFSNGLARIESGRKLGYLDRTGKLVWEPQYPIFAEAAPSPAPEAAKKN